MASKNKTQIIAEQGKQELFIIREFDASRELVFKAYSVKELLEEWVGPRDLPIKYERFEPYAGGSYRYYHTLPNDMQLGFHGVCHEHIAHERIIQTMEFEGLPEKVMWLWKLYVLKNCQITGLRLLYNPFFNL